MSFPGLVRKPGPAAFDGLAAAYDDLFTHSRIGQAQRRAVWREIDRHFHSGQLVLDFNCGTGEDALHLARRGLCVVASDISAEMISVARERANRDGLESSVQFHVLPTEEIRRLEHGTKFDGAISNFAGLNCIKDLSRVAADLAGLLKPDAKLIICMFGRFCLWEILWYGAHGNVQKAFRRIRMNTSPARMPTGGAVPVEYPSVRDIKRAFMPHFRWKSWRGVGVAVPPSYLEPWAVRHPRLLRVGEALDRSLGRVPTARSLADHVLLTFERFD